VVIVWKRLMRRVHALCHIQGDSGQEVNILGCDMICHCEKKAYVRGAGYVLYTG
jgi:hypothetical protein